MGAIILEANLALNEYYHVKNDDEAQIKAKFHIKEAHVCKHLAKIVKQTVLIVGHTKMISWEEMVAELKKVSFKSHHGDYAGEEE
jgi:hypothetical protein